MGRKEVRVKSYKCLQALENVLHHSFGFGLSYWREPADWKQAVLEGRPSPVLSLAMDEGSTNYSMVWYLTYHHRLLLVPQPDPAHRVWNDCKLALSACGLWPHVLLAACVFRFPHGPYEQGTGLEQTKAGLGLFLRAGSPCRPFVSSSAT